MLVIHELAHSAPRARGAVTAHGTTEREVARRADHGLRRRLEAGGHEVVTITGKLQSNIRRAKAYFIKAQARNRHVCAVSLHYNSTPLEDCPECGGVRHKGGVCSCGAQSGVRWQFGHRAIVRYEAPYSHRLADAVLTELGQVITWSTRRSLILAPDPSLPATMWPNTLLWPRAMLRPSALIEAGFSSDPRFADWIRDRANQRAYGMAVGEGIIRWHDSVKAAVVGELRK